MAPNWTEQIKENLGLIHANRNTSIAVYTSRQPNSRTWTVYAVKNHKDERQEVLSATERDLDSALETLHTMSANEVNHHVDAYGFGPVHGSKSSRDRDASVSSSDSEASTMDDSVDMYWSESSSSSDGEIVVTPKRKKSKSAHRKHKHRSTKRSRRESSVSSEDSGSDSETPPRRRHAAPAARPSYIPAPPITTSQRPPPPPGWRGPPVFPRGPGGGLPPPLPPPGRFTPGMRPPTSMTPPAMAQGSINSAPTPPPPGLSKPVRLVIKWAGHGERKAVEHCMASHRALQRVALAYVRANWQSFENVAAQEMTSGRLWGLGAKVRRVAFGQDMYTISAAAGDDLGMYFKADEIPMFEIEVDHDINIIPPPPPPPPHPMQ